jgi:hypothetical protein
MIRFRLGTATAYALAAFSSTFGADAVFGTEGGSGARGRGGSRGRSPYPARLASN